MHASKSWICENGLGVEKQEEQLSEVPLLTEHELVGVIEVQGLVFKLLRNLCAFSPRVQQLTA